VSYLENIYHYFLSYKHKDGYGNLEMKSPVPIRDLKDIQAIQEHIKKDVQEKERYEAKNICITHFQLFDN
jgi:CRISPR/Cas system CMR-associated protein Cmr1 (group 7 of RAMP superfamily)